MNQPYPHPHNPMPHHSRHPHQQQRFNDLRQPSHTFAPPFESQPRNYGGYDTQPRRPAPVAPPSRFVGLAWAAVIIGIVAIVGSIVPFLNNLTALAAVVGVILGIIAVFGTRRVLALVGVGLCIAGIVFTVMAQGAFVASLNEEFGTVGGPEALADATVADCTIVDDGYGPRAQGLVTIVNPTDTAQTYSVTVSVNGADGVRIGEFNAFSNSLGAGQSVNLSGIDASGLISEGTETGPVDCTVASVSRFSG